MHINIYKVKNEWTALAVHLDEVVVELQASRENQR